MSKIPQTILPDSNDLTLPPSKQAISDMVKSNPGHVHYAVGYFSAAKYAHLLPKEAREQMEKEIGQWGVEAMNRLNKELNS